MIAVESNVPVPSVPEERRPGRPQRYPWSRLEIGDSFHAAGVNRNAIRCSATNQEHRRGHVYRIEPEGQGFRVWRTA